MENFEKDGNENILENEINNANGENQQESAGSEASSELVKISDEIPGDVTELDKEEALTAPLYRWNYEEYNAAQAEVKKKKRGNGAFVYAVSMTCAFIVAFSVLVILLITAPAYNGGSVGSGGPSGSAVTSERIVYVREHDDESGVLTPQEIYNKCLPSVVSISVKNGSSAGIGSGFIISEDGYIITANHVVENTDSITVVLSTGESFRAEVVDGNAFTDLALIKIEKTGLTPIEMGRSSDLLVGDDVVAIGTPASIDFAGSMASGHVSFKNRSLKIYGDDGLVEKKMMLVQTDALVNPGNSGCPLINEYGQAVGVVTMKLKSTYYEGMCFAIPIDAAMPIINAMKNGEDYDELLGAISTYPAKLGVSVADAYVSSAGVHGIKIEGFLADTHDISRKMSVGDIITKIDSVVVTDTISLKNALVRYKPGDTVRISFYKGTNGTQLLSVSVVLS